MLVAGWFLHILYRRGLRAIEPLSPRGCLFSLDLSFPRYEWNGVWHLVTDISSSYKGLRILRSLTNLYWSKVLAG